MEFPAAGGAVRRAGAFPHSPAGPFPAAAPPGASPPGAADPAWAGRPAGLREAARQLEAGFIAEMLKAGGLGEAREAFGGGAGEEQFASFLRDELARALAARGGFGLADQLYRAMEKRYGPGT